MPVVGWRWRAQEIGLDCWYPAGWKGMHIARKPFPLLCQTSSHDIPLPAFQLPEVTHPSSAETLCSRGAVPLPTHSGTSRPKANHPHLSQTSSVPESTSTFLQSSLHTCPISVPPKSFEGKLEVELQTNCPFGPPHQLGGGAKSTVWLRRHRCR